jgi:prevent-host-death family protein
MSHKSIGFSKARNQLRRLLDEVQRSGRPVTILRRGKPQAVLVSYEQFEKKAGAQHSVPWRLAGSLRARRGVDIDATLHEVRELMKDTLERRLAGLGGRIKGS